MLLQYPRFFIPLDRTEKRNNNTLPSRQILLLLTDSLDLNRRWQLKAGVYPNKIITSGMVVFRLTLRQSVLLHHYIVVAPYICRRVSSIKPAVQNGA